jgi:hypothetical protein
MVMTMMMMMMAVTMNSIRTRVSGRKASRCQVPGSDGLRKWLYYSYQGFSRWTCAVLDHFLCSHFENSHSQAIHQERLPLHREWQSLVGIYSSHLANLPPIYPSYWPVVKYRAAMQQRDRSTGKMLEFAAVPHPARHGEILDECPRRGTSVQEARGEYGVSWRYCCLSIH